MAGTDVFFLECSDVQMLQSELNSRLAHKVMRICVRKFFCMYSDII